jgi:hypothetical protein
MKLLEVVAERGRERVRERERGERFAFVGSPQPTPLPHFRAPSSRRSPTFSLLSRLGL